MSKYGWTGETNREKPASKWTPEELERIKETDRQYKAQINRSAAGPAFRRRNLPKVPFLQKYGAVIGGFLGTGCAFFFLISPFYHLFIEQYFRKAPNRIYSEDPTGILNQEIEICYKLEHWGKLKEIRDSLPGKNILRFY